SPIYTDGLICPVGYNLVRDIQVVEPENLTWSEAAMECIRKKGRILTVVGNQSEQIAKDAMEKSLGKTWVGYTGYYIKDELDESDLRTPFYIMKYIKDEQFDASSFSEYAEHARIDNQYAWWPKAARLGQWVQVDLRKTMCIHGIVTKGHKNTYQWTTVYKLHYRNKCSKFHIFENDGKEELTANKPTAYQNFTEPFNAQFIRLYPQKWNKDYPAIRFDLLVSNDSCPTDLPCGKCPAIMNTPTGNVTVQYEPCCSKLPYICEIELCDQDHKEAPTQAIVTDSPFDYGTPNPEIQKESSTLPTITELAIDNTTNIPGANHGNCPCALCSTSLTIGLAIGMGFFMIVSVILLILLILSQHYKNSCIYACTYPSKAGNEHHIDTNKKDFNQTVEMVTPKVTSKAELVDLYSQVDIKTKHQKSELVSINKETDDTTYDTACHDTTNNATASAQYHTPVDVDLYSVEQKVGEGKTMDINDLYTQVDIKTKVPKSDRSGAKKETDQATWTVDAVQYHSIADVDNYNVEQKVDDCKPLDEANDLFTAVDDKTKVQKSERSVAKKKTDESTWKVGAVDTTRYHTTADVDNYSAGQKVDDCEIPDGIEMMGNEIYSDA
ncbi:unnamed protein product, partial [Owenia fusiformis]